MRFPTPMLGGNPICLRGMSFIVTKCLPASCKELSEVFSTRKYGQSSAKIHEIQNEGMTFMNVQDQYTCQLHLYTSKHNSLQLLPC